MNEAVLILWLATLGADRIDFLAGSGPFLLTPFLVLTPLVLGVQLLRLFGRGGRLHIPGGTGRYAQAVTALTAVAVVSVLFSVEVDLASRRLVLLLVQTYSTLLVAVFIANLEDPARVLRRGAYAGLMLGFAFNVIQVGIWLGGGAATHGRTGVLFLDPWMYGPWIPRLSGTSMDMNRGGFLFLTYLFLLLRFAKPSRLRAAFISLAAFSVLATLSRSTMLAMAVVLAIYVLQRRSFTASPALVRNASLMGAGFAALLLFYSRTVAAVMDYLAPALTLRFLGDGSSSIHFALMEYGLELGTSSVRNALLGVGFGNSFAVLEEFFPGDKYGNFHSLYVSLWVETGFLSLCLGLLVMIYPLLRSPVYRPMLGGVLAFNLFYQSTLEPTFWFLLAAAWMELASSRVRPEADSVRPSVPGRVAPVTVPG